MIPVPLEILIAFILDALLGDPRWLPHPVVAIGRLALALESPLRKLIGHQRAAGIIAVLLVLGATALVTGAILLLTGWLHPLLGDLAAILLLYFCFAARSLSSHALAVKRSLDAGDLPEARQRVGLLVGRDTEQLDAAEISRAAVESVAENTVDGVTAPLLFALVGGPLPAMLYKAINTLDSTFGYRNERYLEFGWLAAKLDDVANFIPARLTALLTPLAAVLLKLDGRQAWEIFCRDRNNHPSPNGGQIEAAMAGALGVRLGGVNSYFGKESFRPYMGVAKRPLVATTIGEVVRLMWLTALLTGVFGLLGRLTVLGN